MSAEAGLTLSQKQDEALFRDVLANALVEAVDRKLTLRFDTIIVDEGQDFRDSWLDALKLTLCDLEAGRLYVFYDDNQRLYSFGGGLHGGIAAVCPAAFPESA